jgi:hypothetical protein
MTRRDEVAIKHALMSGYAPADVKARNPDNSTGATP